MSKNGSCLPVFFFFFIEMLSFLPWWLTRTTRLKKSGGAFRLPPGAQHRLKRLPANCGVVKIRTPLQVGVTEHPWTSLSLLLSFTGEPWCEWFWFCTAASVAQSLQSVSFAPGAVKWMLRNKKAEKGSSSEALGLVAPAPKKNRGLVAFYPLLQCQTTSLPALPRFKEPKWTRPFPFEKHLWRTRQEEPLWQTANRLAAFLKFFTEAARDELLPKFTASPASVILEKIRSGSKGIQNKAEGRRLEPVTSLQSLSVAVPIAKIANNGTVCLHYSQIHSAARVGVLLTHLGRKKEEEGKEKKHHEPHSLNLSRRNHSMHIIH